jgi:hypothetical protein
MHRALLSTSDCSRARAAGAVARRGLVVLVGVAAAAFSLTGCTTEQAVRVKPWQRATLADATMNPDRDPLAGAMADHVFTSREAASGGRGVGGT